MFGLLVAALSVAGLFAVAVFTGAVSAPFSRGFSTPEPDAGSATPIAPCPPDGTLPVPYGSIQVNVLNGTKRAGLATETAGALASRGFVVVSTGNSPGSVTGAARVNFGAAGVGAAYTLAAQVEGAVLVLDARTDGTVDLAVGTDFTALLDPSTITLDAAVALTGVPGCVPLADAVPAPAPVPDPVAEPAPAAG